MSVVVYTLVACVCACSTTTTTTTARAHGVDGSARRRVRRRMMRAVAPSRDASFASTSAVAMTRRASPGGLTMRTTMAMKMTMKMRLRTVGARRRCTAAAAASGDDGSVVCADARCGGDGRMMGWWARARTRTRTRTRRRGDDARARYMGSGTYDSYDSYDEIEDDPERTAFDGVEWHAQTLAKRTKDVLRKTDSSGIWTVGTTVGVFVIAGLESLEAEAAVRGEPLEMLLPPIVPLTFVPALKDGGIERAEQVLQAVFLFEYIVRAWSEEFKLKYLRSPTALIDFLSLLPTFGFLLSLLGIGGAGQMATDQFRPLRLFRVLRLLRVLDLDGSKDKERNKGTPRVKNQNEKVVAVAVEFLCVFLISGELFYDLEVDKNPNISDVGDAIYWSFLTLTGIGQPFEAVTAEGRIATVAAILTALVVVPLQLAVLVSAQTEAQQAQDALPAGTPPQALGPAARLGFGAPVPITPVRTNDQIAMMREFDGAEFMTTDSTEDSKWLRIREKEELRAARKQIRSMELQIESLRESNEELRSALYALQPNLSSELEKESKGNS